MKKLALPTPLRRRGLGVAVLLLTAVSLFTFRTASAQEADHLADHAGAVVARVSQFVQLFAVPRADKAALFGADGRIFHKGVAPYEVRPGDDLSFLL